MAKTENRVRGVVIKNHIVFPFAEDQRSLHDARIPFRCIKVETLRTARELLTRAKIRLALAKWEDVGPVVISRLAAKTGAKTKKNQFALADEDEDVIREAIHVIRTELAQYHIAVEFLVEKRSLSKTGKLLKKASETGPAAYYGLVTFRFDPDQEPVNSTLEAIQEASLTLGGRRITLSHLKALKSVRGDILHVRLSTADASGVEIEPLSTFDLPITADTRLTLKAFAFDIINRLT